MRMSLCVAVVISCLGTLSGRPADDAAQPALAWHFAGLDALRKSNPEALFNEIRELKNSEYLGNQIRSLITAQFPRSLDISPQLLSADVVAPLVADLLKHESAARLTGDHYGQGDWVLAVALDATNADLWSATLLKMGRRLGLGEPVRAGLDGLKGWTLPATATQKGYSILINKDWVLVANRLGDDLPVGQWAKSIAQEGRPVPTEAINWLTLAVHPAAFDRQPSLPLTGKITHLEAEFSWQGQNIRSNAKILLAEDHTPSGEEWKIPKGIAHDPLVSFTAVRGLKSFIGGLDAFKGLSSDLVPDQCFGWTLGSVAFIHDFALPVNDAGKVFSFLEKSVPTAYNSRILEFSLGKWLMVTNQTTGLPRLLWRGLPVFVPYLGPTNDGGQGFLYGGVFPMDAKTNTPPAPQDLFSQFETRNNLLYYDWEISPARLSAFNQIHPFVELVVPPAKVKDKTYGDKWLKDVQPKLGNVVTEIASVGPRELSLTRKSQLGMTGIELWLFTHWLDSEQFPKFPYGKPRKPEHGTKPGGLPGAAAPETP